MSLFQCDECGVVENTAYSNFWYEHVLKKGPKLCSACTKEGHRTKKWHGKFDRVYLPLGMFITNETGDIAHKETGETDYTQYIVRIES